MSQLDLEQFLRERLQQVFPDQDVGPGSDVDQRFTQAVLRRVGPDPFSTNVRAFLLDSLNQSFPDMPTGDLDGISELLILPMELLLTPMTQEVQRLRKGQSLQAPDLLTLSEAEALGANFFRERNRGDSSRGVGRLYYDSPRGVTVTSANVFLTRSQLGYVPNVDQSISSDQMLFNVEGSLYFFDVNLVAVSPGEQYNIEPGELIGVIGLTAVRRVTNKGRFRSGQAEATAEEYIQEVRDSLGEQSLVTTPGLIAQTRVAFPELTRMAVVGADDPRMMRDVLRGGSLGSIQVAGVAGSAANDGNGRPTTTRFATLDAGMQLLGLRPPLVLTLISSSFEGNSVDLPVKRVISNTSLELEQSLIPQGLTGLPWMLRRRELVLDRIPGGILAPTEAGTAVLPADSVHVGGMADVYARGPALDSFSFTLDRMVDEEPLATGSNASGSSTSVTLEPVLGTGYLVGGALYNALKQAGERRWALQLLDGPCAGMYEVLSVTQEIGSAPVVHLLDSLPTSSGLTRWRLLDALNMSLSDPKETLHRGTDLETFQGQDSVSTSSLVDFQALGVEEGCVLRIEDGLDADDYPILEILPAPAFSRLRLDRPLQLTRSSLSFVVFRPNAGGRVASPVVRITKAQLLDSTGGLTSTEVPYGASIGGYTTALTNPARGVKLEVPDALLGLVTQPFGSGLALAGKYLEILVMGEDLDAAFVSLAFTGPDPVSVFSAIAQINAAAGFTLAVLLSNRRIGFINTAKETRVVGAADPSYSALPALFGGLFLLSSRMVRSPSFNATTFTELSPVLSLQYDVLQVQDGGQIGAYALSSASPYPLGSEGVDSIEGLVLPPHVLLRDNLSPEFDVRVQLGARSQGTLRCYFLQPTTAEFLSSQTVFVADPGGAERVYRPDYAFESRLLPAAPSGSKSHDAIFTGGDPELTSSINFIRKRIRPGDVVIVDYVAMTGSVVLADPVASLAFKTLVLSFGEEASRTVTFVNDSDSIATTAVTRQGVVDQINAAMGVTIASLTSDDRLQLDPEFLLIVRGDGTANSYLGFSSSDTSNRSLNAGRYTVLEVGNEQLTLDQDLAYDESGVQYFVVRSESQRIGTTQMAAQLGEAGLYYADVEIVSDGTGDSYNLPNGTYMEVRGARVDGYVLTTSNPLLTFSPEEEIGISFSRTINPLGSDDDPEQSVPLTGAGLQLQGDRSELVAGIHSFLLSDDQRDICSNPLARCLTPHFVRYSLNYAGGPKPSTLLPELETQIHSLFPDQALETTAITSKVVTKGGSNLSGPLTLYVVTHLHDRSVKLLRSQDSVNVDALAAFYPDVISLTRV